MKLVCGCEIPFMDKDGKAVVRMFDGMSGLNVQCPTHGWTLQKHDKSLEVEERERSE